MHISGGGSASPATVSFPGAYSGRYHITYNISLFYTKQPGTDPGIKLNIYQTLSSYTIPGPPVFSCSGSSSPAPSSASTATAHSTTVAVHSTTAAASSPTGATAAHYAQCGGTGYVYLS
jgi:lytic cellulose monooxygenase (C1-hydroxylating)